MKPSDLIRTAHGDGREVRSAVVERLVEGGVDRARAQKFAEGSYRRVLNRLDTEALKGSKE